MATFVYSGLAHAAFPSTAHPDALIHVPDRLRGDSFGLVVYLHGFENCIENVAAPPPGIHDPPQPTANLVAQLESVGKNAILLLPEAGYHVKSADGGQLAEAGGFARLFREVLGRLRNDCPQLAAVSDDVAPHVMLVSHSGGYKLAAQIALSGGLPIAEIALLDSLYGSIESFDAITDGFLAAYRAGDARHRFVNLYRQNNTGRSSVQQADRLRAQLKQLQLPESLLSFDADAGSDANDVPTNDETLDAALSHLFAVKSVSTDHSDFGRTYFASLLRTSFLP